MGPVRFKGQSGPNHPLPPAEKMLQGKVAQRDHSYSQAGLLAQSQFSGGQVSLQDSYLENTAS